MWQNKAISKLRQIRYKARILKTESNKNQQEAKEDFFCKNVLKSELE